MLPGFRPVAADVYHVGIALEDVKGGLDTHQSVMQLETPLT